MKRLFNLLTSCIIIPVAGLAQEGTWTLSAGAGYAIISLGAVKADMERDVGTYNEAGFGLPPFPSPSPGIALTAAASYRFDRDYSFSINAHHDTRTVETSWSNQEDDISLKRRIKATVVSAGVVHHFPGTLDTDIFVEVEVGILFARATSYAYWTHTEKLFDSTSTEVLGDTRGVFERSKMIASVGAGGSVRLFGPMFLRGKLLYRVGQLGKIDGSITKFGQTMDQTTTIEFNFSGFLILASIGIELS
ncbi:MAG: hypothetical protein WEB33_04000 [Bacteroidota bacterium]